MSSSWGHWEDMAERYGWDEKPEPEEEETEDEDE